MLENFAFLKEKIVAKIKRTNLRFAALVFMLLIASCGQQKLEEGKFRLIGKVTGMTDGELYLMEYPNADTIRVKNGTFEIEGNIEGISSRYLMIDQNSESMEATFPIYLEPTIMELTIDVNDLKNAQLKGSKTQDESYQFGMLQEKLRVKYKAELDAFELTRKKYDEAKSKKATEEELEIIKEEDFMARGKLEPYFKESKNASLNFIKNNPNSFISLQNMRFQLSDMKYDEAFAIFDSFPETLKNSKQGKDIGNEINKMKFGIPGAVASNFTSTDIDGNPLHLSDFRGKYLLIDFWASWCVPCRKGNPHLLKLYAKYNTKGFEILGVSDNDEKPDAWRKAVKKDGIGVWHHILRGLKYDEKTGYNRETDINEGYNIYTLPTKILINPKGVIIGRYGTGGEDHEALDKKLEEIFE